MKYYVKRMKKLLCTGVESFPIHMKKAIHRIAEQNVSYQFCTKEGRRIYNYICLQCNF